MTLPGCRYGLISAGFVVFTLAFTDFGVPKVIGGSYNVLATDVYKQVIGQFNFQMGAVVGLLLLTPAVISFLVDRVMQRRQVALLSARAVPYEPKPSRRFDIAGTVYCGIIACPAPRHPCGGRVRLGHRLLALRSVADLEELRFRQYRHAWLGRLLEQPETGVGNGDFRNGDRLRRRVSGREDGGVRDRPRADPSRVHDPAGGAGRGARAFLHLLLQRRRQSR